jgi:hypothetical protein
MSIKRSDYFQVIIWLYTLSTVKSWWINWESCLKWTWTQWSFSPTQMVWRHAYDSQVSISESKSRFHRMMFLCLFCLAYINLQPFYENIISHNKHNCLLCLRHHDCFLSLPFMIFCYYQIATTNWLKETAV